MMASSAVCPMLRMYTIFCKSSSFRECNALKRQLHPSFHKFNKCSLVSFDSSNSQSRLRQGFSPSVVRKSVHRDSMLPCRCFMITLMLLLFSFGDQNNDSSFV